MKSDAPGCLVRAEDYYHLDLVLIGRAGGSWRTPEPHQATKRQVKLRDDDSESAADSPES